MVPAFVIQVDESDAALDQSPGQQAVARERRLARLGAVQLHGLLRLARQVHQFRGARLHAIRQLVGGDAGDDLGVAHVAEMGLVEPANQVERIALEARIEAVGAGHVEDRISLGPERDALVGRRQEAARPVGRAPADPGPRRQDDEPRQVARLAAQPVRDPRAHARPTGQRRARIHEDLRRRVIELVRMDRLDDRNVIYHSRQVRQDFRNLGAAVSMAAEGESRGHQAGVGADEGIPLTLHKLGGHGLAVVLLERVLVVEKVELAGRSGHEQVNDSFRPGCEVRRFRRHRIGGSSGLALGFHQQRSQRDLADPHAAIAEEMTARDQAPPMFQIADIRLNHRKNSPVQMPMQGLARRDGDHQADSKESTQPFDPSRLGTRSITNASKTPG